MGRPLNKKYFGNRNIGTGGYQTTQHGISNTNTPINDGDDHIGGEGIGGVTFSAAVADVSYGSGAYLDRIPTDITFAAPTIANGVTAQGHVTNVQAVHGVVNVKGTGYQIGDVVELTDGTGTKARFRVTKLRVVSVSLNGNGNNSINWDGGEWIVWDQYVNSHWTSPTVLKGLTISGSGHHLTGYNSGTSVYGVWDGTDGTHAPTGPIAIVGGGQPGTPPSSTPTYNTRGTSEVVGQHPTGGTTDNNGTGGFVTFTYGIEEVVVVTQGNYTAVSNAASGVTNITVGATGANATLDVYYGITAIAITEKGSGYAGTEAVTFSAVIAGHQETQATGTIVLTQDTGAVGSATNQENAIIAYAWVDGLEEVDIIKQVSTDRFRINSNATGNSDTGYVIGKLKVDGVANDSYSVAEGTQMNIWAFDANGDSYLVKKLTARKAVVYPFACARLTKSAGTLFAAGRAIPWKFFEGQANASAGYVKIENA